MHTIQVLIADLGGNYLVMARKQKLHQFTKVTCQRVNYFFLQEF